MIDITFSVQDSQELNSVFHDTTHQFFSFIDSLDIGDISCDLADEQRKTCLSALVGEAHNTDFTEELKTDWSENRICADKLKSTYASAEDIYIWYHSAPAAICGMYAIVDYFAGCENNVFIIKLPEYQNQKSTVLSCASWYQYDFRKTDLLTFVAEHAIMLPTNIRRIITAKWKSLKFQNKMLRVVLNGTVISADETFYDIFITAQLTNRTKKIIDVISDVYNLKIHIPQWWIERRINFLIREQIITVCRPNADYYNQEISLKPSAEIVEGFRLM